MLNKICKICLVPAMIISPLFAYAVLDKTSGILDSAYNIVTDILIPMVFVLALLVFFYGIVKYVWSEGAGKDEGKKIMIWGVVALFVMSSVWGIVAFVRIELGVGSDSSMPVPTIDGGGSGDNNDSVFGDWQGPPTP